ncbi:nuclear valosin-containing protein-like isoform X2 [Ischnura elegans]|nr:nuclear valosin-containing protein-like isoform X2 [Ischnura elegans]
MKPMKRLPYFADHLMVPRVRQYMEDNKNKVYIDIDVMAKELQDKYVDYRKKKRDAFRSCVEKAFNVVIATYGIGQDNYHSNSPEGSDAFDSDDLELMTDGNEMNNTLESLYTQNSSNDARKSIRPRNDDLELIDISSDEDVPEEDGDGQQDYLTDNSYLHHESSSSKSASKQSTEQSNKVETSTSGVSDRGKKRKAPDGAPGGVAKKSRDVQETITFRNFAGNEKVLEEVCKLVVHLKNPDVYQKLGMKPPRGFLLHGPPGCGKTLLAHALAGELQLPLVKVAATELVAGVSGESEERIRELFEKAVSLSPCILFLDEVDAITPHRVTAQREMERRIVAQLLSSLDELGKKEGGDQVLVVGASNRPDAIDPALRRAGRFDREVCIGIPDERAREKILGVLCSDLRLSGDVNLELVARNSPGYVGADLQALAREAAMKAVDRVFKKMGENKKKNSSRSSSGYASRNSNGTEAEEPLKVNCKEEQPAVPGSTETKPEASKVAGNQEETPKTTNDDSKVDESGDKARGTKESASQGPAEPVANGRVTGSKGEGDSKRDEDDNTDGSRTTETTVLSVEEAEVASPPKGRKPLEGAEEPKGDEFEERMEVEEGEGDEMGSDLERWLSWVRVSDSVRSADLEDLFVEAADFEAALKIVQPSAKREGFATVPDVSWDAIGSLADVREELQMNILAPVKHPREFAAMGLKSAAGVLLCGPPGCGKTLLAKAVANEAGINFISVKGPELLNMYVGESERAVRQCFQRARSSAPCVIFFDELDALCPKRNDSADGGAGARVVNQMLTEMDGMDGRKGVYLMAASNRPEIIDPAILRPGRLDKIIYVGIPSSTDRVEILKAICKNGREPVLSPNVNLEAIGQSERCNGFTGADLAALVREAGVAALKEFVASGSGDSSNLMICEKHFHAAFDRIRPSVPEKDVKYYERIRRIYSSGQHPLHSRFMVEENESPMESMCSSPLAK